MTCPRCDRPVPVDGPVAEAHCIYCQNDLSIDREYWITNLREACSDMENTKHGQGTGSMMFGTNTGNMTLSRFDLYCDNCKTDFENPWELEAGQSYQCKSCGSQWPVQHPPEWLSEAVPRIRQLVNALIDSPANPDDAIKGNSASTISCPSCAGNLSVDGSSRLVRCKWCDTQVYLPDELWKRIHGVRVKRRWFVVCEYRKRND